MLTIRLSRIGKKNKPMYRLIISEKARDPYGRALEILGSYNPYTKELQSKQERIKHWLSKGAGMSPTVNNLLVENNIIKGKKVKASGARKKKSSSAKAMEDKKTKADTLIDTAQEQKIEKTEIETNNDGQNKNIPAHSHEQKSPVEQQGNTKDKEDKK
ncbi:30S ribosomal protein S16 [Candidatus Parcubacteria bacterium]|nr:30S ribosomal protein S16 [Candidatus Parcubacteria bacterium]